MPGPGSPQEFTLGLFSPKLSASYVDFLERQELRGCVVKMVLLGLGEICHKRNREHVWRIKV